MQQIFELFILKDFMWICMDKNQPLEIVEDIVTFTRTVNQEEEEFLLLLNDIKDSFNTISKEGLSMFSGHVFLFKDSNNEV